MSEKLNTSTDSNLDNATNNISELSKSIEKQQQEYGIWKIQKAYDSWVVVWEKGIAIINKKDKTLKFPVYTKEELSMWEIKQVYSDGRIVLEEWLCLLNLEKWTIRPLYFSSFWIKWFKEFRDDGTFISDTHILFFDIKKRALLKIIELKDIWAIEKTIHQSDCTIYKAKQWVVVINSYTRKEKVVKYSVLGIWKVKNVKESNFRENSWIIIEWEKAIIKLDIFWEISIKINEASKHKFWEIDSISNRWFVFWDKGIAKFDENGKEKWYLSANDLGFKTITTFGSWKVIWVDKNWKWQVAKVNLSIWEVLYKSTDVDPRKIKRLSNLWIMDIDRMWSENFLDHIIKNRENIEELWKKEIILIIQSRSDHNWAFSVDNQDNFIASQDVLYYEVWNEKELEDVFKELSTKLPKDADIDHFILWGHWSQKSIQFSDNIFDFDNWYLNTSDWEKFRKYAPLFKKTKSIVLKSCSTWKWGLKSDNILNMVAGSFWRHVKDIVAPQVPTNNLYDFQKDLLFNWVRHYMWPLFHTDNLSIVKWIDYKEKQ